MWLDNAFFLKLFAKKDNTKPTELVLMFQHSVISSTQTMAIVLPAKSQISTDLISESVLKSNSTVLSINMKIMRNAKIFQSIVSVSTKRKKSAKLVNADTSPLVSSARRLTVLADRFLLNMVYYAFQFPTFVMLMIF